MADSKRLAATQSVEKMNRTLRILFAIFVVSGFCGLIYQSIWSHYLKLFLGHAAYSQTLVLIVFIGGMALGAWIAGRFSNRIKNALFAYAAAEFLIGVVAIGFHSIYVGATEWAYASLLPTACDPESWCAAQWLLGAVLILPQSVLLGTTFPMMTAGVLRLAPQDPGHKISTLYFLNSIGAVAGVLVSSFVLIPSFGLPGAQLTAGIGNIGLAIVAYFLGKFSAQTQRGAAVADAVKGQTASAIGSREVLILFVISALTGLSSFVYEIVWIRMLSLVLGSSTHAFELMLAAFIFGLAAGSLWIRRRIDKIKDTVRFLAIVQILMGILAIATLPVYNAMFDAQGWLLEAIARSSSGYALFNLTSLLIAALVMVPATFFAGMTLPLITYRLLRLDVGERSIGYVYAVNTLGAIGGVVCAISFGLPFLGLKGTLVSAGALDIALGIALLVALTSVGLRLIPNAAWSVAGVAAIVTASVFFHLDPLKTASSVFRTGQVRLDPTTELVYRRDGRAATVEVIRTKTGSISILTNGKSDGAANMATFVEGTSWKPGTDEVTMVLTGALPLAYAPNAKTVAVIGFGTGISTATLLGSPNFERVDTIEIEPAMVDGARHFEPLTTLAYTDPRSHLIFEDARSYFARGQKRYDVIVSEPSNPWVSGVSNLFTEEFYRRIRRYLHEDGLFVQWLQVYETNPRLVASIVTALNKSFPTWTVYAPNAGDLIIVAPKSGRMPKVSSALFEMPAVKEKLERVGIRDAAQLDLRGIGSNKDVGLYLTSLRSNANSDFFPIVDREAPKARFMRSSGDAVHQLGLMAVPAIELLSGRAQPQWSDEINLETYSPQERTKAYAQRIWSHVMHKRPLPESMESAGRTYFIARTAFMDCKSTGNPREDFTGLLNIAYEVSPFVPIRQATEVWDQIQKRNCFAGDEKLTQWVQLFRAVAARDAAKMAATAGQMSWVFMEPGDFTREYVLSAGIVGLLASNRPGDAQRFLDENIKSIAEPRQTIPSLAYLRMAVHAANNKSENGMAVSQTRN